MATYGMVTKEYIGRIAEVMFVKNKQNSSVNFLVRAKFFMRPQRQWRRNNAKYINILIVSVMLNKRHVSMYPDDIARL